MTKEEGAQGRADLRAFGLANYPYVPVLMPLQHRQPATRGAIRTWRSTPTIRQTNPLFEHEDEHEHEHDFDALSAQVKPTKGQVDYSGRQGKAYQGTGRLFGTAISFDDYQGRLAIEATALANSHHD